MTLSTTTQRNEYTANGTQDTFAFSFRILAETDLEVYVAGAIQTLNTHYTVSAGPWQTGGNVIFDADYIPAADAKVIIVRALPRTQEVDLAEGAKMPAESLEQALDRLTMQIQDVREMIQRSAKIPMTQVIGSTEVTFPALVANKYPRVNATADGFDLVDLLSGVTGSTFDQDILANGDIVGDGNTQIRGILDLISKGPLVDVRAYNVAADDSTSDVTPFKNAIAYIKAKGGGTLYVPRGTYYFDVNSSSDTLLIDFDYFNLVCEKGTQFRWDGDLAPLIAVIGADHIDIGGVDFVWSGTRGTQPGVLTMFGYDGTGYMNDQEWGSEIFVGGSNYVRIHDITHNGATTSNVIEHVVTIHNGTASGPTGNPDVYGNVVENCYFNDMAFGLLSFGQNQFRYSNIRSDRRQMTGYDTNPGHVLYETGVLSKNGIIENIVDFGTALDSFNGGAHTVKMIYCTNVVLKNLHTRSDEGSLVLQELKNCVITDIEDLGPESGSRTAYTFAGTVQTLAPATTHDNNLFKNIRIFLGTANRGGITSYTTTFDPTDFNNNRWDNIYIKVDPGAGHSVSMFDADGDGVVVTNLVFDSDGTEKAFLFVKSNGGYVEAKCVGATSSPRIQWGGTWGDSANCRVVCDVPLRAYDTNPAYIEAMLASNTFDLRTHGFYSQKTMSGSTDPTEPFQLPKAGVYLLDVCIVSNDMNHARGGLYHVIYDDVANDFTIANLIGSQYTKGASAPTVLGVAVSNVGVVTITSTAALSTTWHLRYGWTYLSRAYSAS